ncbi:MAG: hypothetical protein ACRD6W_15235, partial [Nitrososphaerales archaeon]
AYDWFEAEYSEPPTPASVFQAGVGTLVGAAAAEVMIERFGGTAELPSQVNEWLSGSADWAAQDTPAGTVVYEHKMKSSYAFNKALGYKRAFGKASLLPTGGPPTEAVAQGAMNALGIEKTHGWSVDNLIVGVVSTEIVSVKENQQINVDDAARFSAEWLVPREVWEPAALKEINRLEQFRDTMDVGYMPDRFALDDDGNRSILTPGGSSWQCNYCPYVSLCQSDGEGQIRVNDSKLIRRKVMADAAQ